MRKHGLSTSILFSFLFWVFFLISVSVTPVSAADELTMKIAPGFKGYAKTGQAFPIKAVIENKGRELNASLEVSVIRNDTRVVYKKEVLLPAGSKKQVEMYIPGFERELYNISLMDGEIKLLEERVKLTEIRPQELVVGVLAADSTTLNYLATIKLLSEGQRVNVINLDADDIPVNSLLLENIDMLVINDFSTSDLSEQQLDSIYSWIEQGGLMAAGGGVNWQKTVGPLGERFLPVIVSGSQSVQTIPGMEKMTGESMGNVDSFVISTGELSSGKVLVTRGDIPIIVQRELGKGNVIYTAYDLAMEPFKNWAGNEKLWWDILSECDPHNIISTGNAREEMVYRSSRYNSFLSSMPAADLPSGGKLAVFLIIYVFIMGPAIYLILKKFDRRDLGWVVIPVVAVLLFSGTYIFGFKNKGRDVFQNVVSLVTLEPDLQYARASSYIGVFAPTKEEYQLDLPGEKIVEVQPLDGPVRMYGFAYGYSPSSVEEKIPVIATISEGQDTRVKFADSSRWSMRTIECEEKVPKSGDISGQLHTADGKIAGLLTNNTGSDLSDCLVLSDYGYQKINRMAAGESVEIAFEPRAIGSDRPSVYQVFSSYPVHKPREMRYRYSSRQEDLSRQILEMIASRGDMENNPVVFIGKSDKLAENALSKTDEGRTYYSTYYIAPLKVSLEQDNRIFIPPGIVDKRVVSLDTQHFHQDMYGYNINSGSVVFQIELPYKSGEIVIDQLLLYIQGDRQLGRRLNFNLYNHKTGAWETVNWVPTGIAIDDTKYVGPDSTIKIELSTGKEQHAYFSDITLTMEGHYIDSNRNGGGE